MEPYLYKQNAEMIIYHLQTKLQMELPEELKNDIYSNVLEAVEKEAGRAREREQYWYSEYMKLKEKGFPLNWNELRIRMSREKDLIDPTVILNWMLLRENGKSIRGPILSDEEVYERLLEPDVVEI